MRKPLFIFGAGGLGREVLALVQTLEEWEPKGFIDDGVEKGKIIKGVPVIGGMSGIHGIEEINLVLAIGDPLTKEKLIGRIPSNVHCPVLVHPRATVLDAGSVRLGRGTIVAAGVVLTTDISIGAHVLLNLNVTVGHDCTIGEGTSVMPGVNIAGHVTIGKNVMLGSGCNIRNMVTIGDRSIVGMGAVVLNEVKEGRTVIGIPARELKK